MDESLGLLGTFIPLVLMVALMYFLLIRPQNKKEKKAAEMRNSIEVGDTVTKMCIRDSLYRSNAGKDYQCHPHG